MLSPWCRYCCSHPSGISTYGCGSTCEHLHAALHNVTHRPPPRFVTVVALHTVMKSFFIFFEKTKEGKELAKITSLNSLTYAHVGNCKTANFRKRLIFVNFLRAQWLISLFLVLRALIFRARWEKNSVPSIFAKFWVCGGCFPEFPPFVQFFTPTWGGCQQKRSLPLFLFFSLQTNPQKPGPRRTILIVKTNRKKSLLMRITMMRSWTACMGIRVGKFILRALFFVFACAHRLAHWTRTRNREINRCALNSAKLRKLALRKAFSYDLDRWQALIYENYEN